MLTAVQNGHRHLKNSLLCKIATYVQNNISVFPIFLSFRNRYEQHAQKTVTDSTNTVRAVWYDKLDDSDRNLLI